jgi:hypothetical protein
MKKILVLFACVALYASGCSSLPSVYSDRLQGVDFNTFRTFAILPVSDTSSTSVYHNSIMEQNLAMEIERQMESRGYVLDKNDPDLLINLTLRMREVDTTVVEPYPITSTYPYYYDGYRTRYDRPYYYAGYSTIPTIYGAQLREVEYTEGMMIIDVIRNSDDNLIWRGWTEEALETPGASAAMQSLVGEILKEYPGRARATSGN